MSRTRAVVGTILALSLSACQAPDTLDNGLRPSLTMVRVGEVEVDDPPPVPEALYVPGINIKPEDYDDRRSRSNHGSQPNGSGAKTDTSFMADLEDPEPLEKHRSGYPYEIGEGALFDENDGEGHLEFTDVEQGSIGDCYLVAALSAVLYADAENNFVTDGMIREVQDADGNVTHYAVRFYDAWGDPQDVEVDAELVRSGSKITYARSMDSSTGSEEWGISLIEKAYAQWHGGYEEIGNGGFSGDMMQALTGATASYRTIEHMSDTSVINSIQEAVAEDRPVVAGTFGKEDGVDYSGTGVYAWHAYTVLGATKAKDEEEARVELRNPWGEVEPAGNGPDDGIFELTLTDFRTLYQGLTLGGSYQKDHTAPGEITDLTLNAFDGEDAYIGFTAPGDDGNRGLAMAYDVRVSTEPITADSFYKADQVTVADPQSPGATEEILVPAEAGRTYFVAVRTEDESGNLSPISEALAFDPADAPIPTADPSFDFESADSDWTVTGLWHRTDTQSVSGDFSYWMGDAESGDYDTGDRVLATLLSPAIAVPENATLTWQQILDVEEAVDDPDLAGLIYDEAVVEIARENTGFTLWEPVWTKDVGDTNTGGFVQKSVDLTVFGGDIVKMRFRFDSHDASANETQGWLVDDVVID